MPLIKSGWLDRKKKFSTPKQYFVLDSDEGLSISNGPDTASKKCDALIKAKLLNDEGWFEVRLETNTLTLKASRLEEAQDWMRVLSSFSLSARTKAENDARLVQFLSNSLALYPAEPAVGRKVYDYAMEIGGIISTILSFTPYRAFALSGRALVWVASNADKAVVIFTEELHQVLPVLMRTCKQIDLPMQELILGLYSSMTLNEVQRALNPNCSLAEIAATDSAGVYPLESLSSSAVIAGDSSGSFNLANVLGDMTLFLRLCIVAGSGTVEEMQWLSRSLGFETVVGNSKTTWTRSAFGLFARKEPSKLAVLAIRGSASDKEWLCNARLRCVPLSDEQRSETGVYTRMCHEGMLHAAKQLADQEGVRDWIRRLRQEGYSVVLTGHSRGAGVVTILNCLLEDEMRDDGIVVRLFAPPACVSEDLADQCAHNTIGVFVGDDIVPRLSVANLQKLSEDLRTTKQGWAKPVNSCFGKIATIALKEAPKTQRLDGRSSWNHFWLNFQHQFHSVVWWMHFVSIQTHSKHLIDTVETVDIDDVEFTLQNEYGNRGIGANLKSLAKGTLQSVTDIAKSKLHGVTDIAAEKVQTVKSASKSAFRSVQGIVARAREDDYSYDDHEEQEGDNDDDDDEDDLSHPNSRVRLVPGGRLIYLAELKGQKHAVLVDHRWQGLRKAQLSPAMINHHLEQSILTAMQEAIFLSRNTDRAAPQWGVLDDNCRCRLSGRARADVEKARDFFVHCYACGQIHCSRLCSNMAILPHLGVLHKVPVCDACCLARQGDGGVAVA